MMRGSAPSAPELLAAYDALVRRRPLTDAPDDAVEHADGVVRVVSASRLERRHLRRPRRPRPRRGDRRADRALPRPAGVEALRPRRTRRTWPSAARRGFESEEPETLMVADLDRVALDEPAPPGIELRTVGAEGVDDLVAVHDAVFGGSHADVGAAVLAGLPRGTVVPVVAYDGPAPVAAARLELYDGTPFAGLWGDSTLPSHRGRGIFRALVSGAPLPARRGSAAYRAPSAICRPTRWRPAARCSPASALPSSRRRRRSSGRATRPRSAILIAVPPDLLRDRLARRLRQRRAGALGLVRPVGGGARVRQRPHPSGAHPSLRPPPVRGAGRVGDDGRPGAGDARLRGDLARG